VFLIAISGSCEKREPVEFELIEIPFPASVIYIKTVIQSCQYLKYGVRIVTLRLRNITIMFSLKTDIAVNSISVFFVAGFADLFLAYVI
jgi:hypothetical protein